MRTAAVQCQANQPMIDKVIPIYFEPEEPKAGAETETETDAKAKAKARTEGRMSVLLI